MKFLVVFDGAQVCFLAFRGAKRNASNFWGGVSEKRTTAHRHVFHVLGVSMCQARAAGAGAAGAGAGERGARLAAPLRALGELPRFGPEL